MGGKKKESQEKEMVRLGKEGALGQVTVLGSSQGSTFFLSLPSISFFNFTLFLSFFFLVPFLIFLLFISTITTSACCFLYHLVIPAEEILIGLRESKFRSVDILNYLYIYL